MTEEHADQIIDYLYGMLRPPDPVETRKAWKVQLAHLDVEIASKAAINGMQVWEFFPSWPSFYGEYRALVRSSRILDPVSCKTCAGDKFVLISLRSPETSEWMRLHKISACVDDKIEELAPCPDCNSGANTSFRRPDGTEISCPDSSRVRDLMSR